MVVSRYSHRLLCAATIALLAACASGSATPPSDSGADIFSPPDTGRTRPDGQVQHMDAASDHQTGADAREASTDAGRDAGDATVSDAAPDGPPGHDAGVDASSHDAGQDAAHDVAHDAAEDAPHDAPAGSAPTVVSTSPAAGASGVASSTPVSLTFDTAMDPITLTTNTTDTTCSGTLQLSADSFMTCVQMTASPVASNSNTTFTVTPATALSSATAYSVRVTVGAKAVSEVPLASAFTSSFTVRYFHTITIDGTNDFTANETFATTSAGYTGYLAWDATYLYVGLSGPDVASMDMNKNILVYLGGVAGTTTGITYNTQTATLPFSAEYEVLWSADNAYTDAQTWNGAAWIDATWDFSGDVFENGAFLEMRFPLASLGSPTTLPINVSFINTTNGVEATYSGVPSTVFTDGYDPAYAHYLTLALQGSGYPVSSPVLP